MVRAMYVKIVAMMAVVARALAASVTGVMSPAIAGWVAWL
jgi:hypothetical protein